MRPSRTKGEDSTVPSVLNAHCFFPVLRLIAYIRPSSDPTKTLSSAMAGDDFTDFSVLKVQRSESRFSRVPAAIPVSDGLARHIGQSALATPEALELARSRQSSTEQQKA